MAQILLINERGHNPGVNNVGDVVAIENDDVYLEEGHHSIFTIVQVPGVSKEQLQQAFEGLIPKPVIIEHADLKEEIKCWDDNGTLRRLVKEPKYLLNLANLQKEDIESLTNTKVPAAERVFTLTARVVDKITTDPTNRLAPIIKASRGG